MNIALFMCHFTLVAGAGHPGVDARHRRSDSLIVGWERSTEIGNTTDATIGLVLVLCSRTIRTIRLIETKLQ